MSVQTVVCGDTATTISVTCTNVDGSVIDLTGASATIEWVINGGALVSKTMSIPAPKTGVCCYTFATGDLATAGQLLYRVIITFAGGAILTTPQSGCLNIIAVL
jgi:hypothetical protein